MSFYVYVMCSSFACNTQKYNTHPPYEPAKKEEVGSKCKHKFN